MKRVSDSGEAVVLVPPVLEPVEVQVPLGAIPVEVRDIRVAIQMPPDRLYKIPSMPPLIEYSPSCTLFRASKPTSILYQVAFIFER